MSAHASRKLLGCAVLLLIAQSALAADPKVGEALYVGEKRFANGGAPCLACHGVAGHGLARAASYGPDLTATFESYGAEALEGALADVPFPSMQPVYNTHALTPAERADVIAFLQKASGTAPSHLSPRFGVAVALAFGVLGVGFVVIGRRGSRRNTSSKRS